MTPDDDTLPEAIRRRIETELLVQRLLAEAVSVPEKRESPLRHPASLVLLTFILTGAIGSMLTERWQARQWRREQRYQAAQELAKERIAAMNRTTEAVAESITAAEDVLHFFSWNWSADSPVVTLQERAAAWNTASHQWRVQQKVLIATVDTTFDGSHVDKVLHEVVQRRRLLGNHIQSLLAVADAATTSKKLTATQEADIEALRTDALHLIAETTGPDGLLGQMTSSMVGQIRNTQRPPAW